MKRMMMDIQCRKWLGYVGVILFTVHCSLFTVSCSEDESGNTEEFVDWQATNDAAINEWAASSSLRKIRSYLQDETAPATNKDYIYVEVLESGEGWVSPLSSDSARVAYRGRLLPSKSYYYGYIFDQSYLGDFDESTMGVADVLVSGTVPGFSTALQNMHLGDRWRVYIPYTLGYNTVSSSTIPAYSNLIFEIVLIDFWKEDEIMTPFKSRRQ